MRIIGGRFRGHRLAPPPRRGVRPTADPLREALFNILGDRVRARPFVDLCAGTGAVGLEALSRGAEPVLLVERARAALRTIEANLRRLGLDPRSPAVRVVRADAAIWLAGPEPARYRGAVVFLDPPYGDPSAPRLAAAVFRSGLLGSDGLLVVEHRAGEVPPAPEPLWSRTYGDAALTAYGPQPSGD
ncbi:MAG: 16S rRNA (guanine(966)-N(2))-methyltransferase RsmD [Acidobacteria bacterium]|nr:MAG: 16S rRNA (guanine(966)-N(2))-methyltransferase RsmD [Acidobacteriota bacterium]